MEVLIYQVVIAVLILLAGAFGKKTRNVVTVIICLFTIVEVFTLKLAILQFITIFLAYFFSISYEEKKVDSKKEELNYYVVDKNKKEKTESSFSSFGILFIIMSSILYTIYVFQKKAEFKKELAEVKDTVIDKEGRRLFDQTYEQKNEKAVIDEVEYNVSTSDINKEDYLNDNFPNSNSEYYDAVRLRTTSLYTKYKELDESWGNWSDKIYLETLIIIYIERNKISILSDVTYRYTDYDIVGINAVRKNVDGKEWEFECIDKDGIPCRIIHLISTNENLMSQVRIEYSDEKKVYNVNREN